MHSLNLLKMYEIRALIQLPEFIIFLPEKTVFCLLKIFFWIKTGFSLIDLDDIFFRCNHHKKIYVPISYTFQEISRQRPLQSGRASSSFLTIQLVLRWSWKCISIFPDFFKDFRAPWLLSRRPYIRLLIGTSFTSLTCNK